VSVQEREDRLNNRRAEIGGNEDAPAEPDM